MSQRALVVLSTTSPAEVKTVPIPSATPGSAIVLVLVANVLPYARIVYDGSRGAPFPTPLVIGSSAVGRITSVGSDATKLKPGALVIIDSFIKGRDDPTAAILFGYRSGPTPASEILIQGEWRDATYAEYAKVPLENCYAFNEERVLGAVNGGGLGYKISDLAAASRLMVPYGGLRDIELQAGETIIVAPATGSFGGAAVQVALAMGARVIAAGRNGAALQKLKSTFPTAALSTVQLTGDVSADAVALSTHGMIDAFVDFSPPAAAKSTHIKSCLAALRIKGRVSIMGGIREDIAIPYFTVMFKSLQLKGKWMYEHQDCLDLIKLIESGHLQLGVKAGHRSEQFTLEQWDEAIVAAEEKQGYGTQILLASQPPPSASA